MPSFKKILQPVFSSKIWISVTKKEVNVFRTSKLKEFETTRKKNTNIIFYLNNN